MEPGRALGTAAAPSGVRSPHLQALFTASAGARQPVLPTPLPFPRLGRYAQLRSKSGKNPQISK